MNIKQHVTGLNIYRAIVVAFVSAAITVGSWGLVRVVDMPNKYIQHTDLDAFTLIIDQMNKKVDTVLECILNLPEKYPYKEDMNRRLDKLERKIDDVILMHLNPDSKKIISDKVTNGGYDKEK